MWKKFVIAGCVVLAPSIAEAQVRPRAQVDPKTSRLETFQFAFGGGAQAVVVVYKTDGTTHESTARPTLKLSTFRTAPGAAMERKLVPRNARSGNGTSFVGNGPAFCDAKVWESADQMLNGWKVEIAAEEAVTTGVPRPLAQDVKVTWQRVRAGGAPVSGPTGSATLTIRAGARVPLDYIPAGGSTGECQAVGMALEIRTGRSGAVYRKVGEPLVEAELWLTNKRPGGPEQSQRQTLRLDPGVAGSYFFDFVQVPTPRGSVAVRVSGTVSAKPNADGTFATTVGIDREFISGSTRLAGGHAESTQSQKPDDVIAFQMPTFAEGAPAELGDALKHEFSLRVRTRTIK